MNETERLNYIKQELEAILKDFPALVNQMAFMQECLKDLERVSKGEDPKRL